MKGIRREASVGREGRELDENPDQIIIAKVKVCRHCAAEIAAEKQRLQAVYEKIEIPQISPIVTQINQYGGKCEHCQKEYLATVPAGMEQGSPFYDKITSHLLSIHPRIEL